MIIKAEEYAGQLERSVIKDAYTVDERWLDFSKFQEDMGEKPEGMFLNRFDRCKPFTKENCQWSTRPELNKHTDKNEMIEYSKMRKTKSGWARHLRVPLSTLRNKARKGNLLEYIQQRLMDLPEDQRYSF